MGYSITATDKNGNEVSYFHIPIHDKDRLLHKALKVYQKGFPELSKVYSKGMLLDSKSYLNKLSKTELELHFINECLDAISNGKTIIITFN